jgi:hypothetical protein
MDDVSMLWLTLDSPIVSQGRQVRVTVGSDRSTPITGPLRFALVNRAGDVIDEFEDHGLLQGDYLAAVFPVPNSVPNGFYSLHVNGPNAFEQGSIDLHILDDVSVSRWKKFFEAAGDASNRNSDDAFECLDRASLERLAETYSETRHWDVSVGVWSYLAYERSADDPKSGVRYCEWLVRDYLSIELTRQSLRTYFRDRGLTVLATLLPPGKLQEQIRMLLESDDDSDPVSNSLLFIDLLLFFGVVEAELTSELSHGLDSQIEPTNLFQVLLKKWPTLCLIDVDREGTTHEPWSFQARHARARNLSAELLRQHVEATKYDDLMDLVEV